MKGVSVVRLGEEFPSRSGSDDETSGSDGFRHFRTSGNSSCRREQKSICFKSDDLLTGFVSVFGGTYLLC